MKDAPNEREKQTTNHADSRRGSNDMNGEGDKVDVSNAPASGPTPEQLKRLTALRAKHTSLTQTSTQLSHIRLLLLRRLTSSLPPHLTSNLSLPPALQKPYTPSTAAHTTPSLPSLSASDETVLMKEAQGIVKGHIRQLHGYNEIKDVAQGLIGIIAEQRGVRIVDVEGGFGVGKGD